MIQSYNVTATIATFECMTGYYINGNSVMSCNIDGTWNDTIPTCGKHLIYHFRIIQFELSKYNQMHFYMNHYLWINALMDQFTFKLIIYIYWKFSIDCTANIH